MNVFKLPSNYNFEKVGIKGKIFESLEFKNDIQFVIVETKKGHETEIIENECDFTYFVIEGNGYFEIEGVKHNVESNDLIIVPKKNKFTYKGKLTMLLVINPPWFEGQEKTVI